MQQRPDWTSDRHRPARHHRQDHEVLSVVVPPLLPWWLYNLHSLPACHIRQLARMFLLCGRERAVIILARVPLRGCVSLPCVIIVLLIWWDCSCGISVLRVLVHGGGIMLRRVQATCSTTCNANVDPGHPKHTPLPPTPPRNRLRSDKKTKQAPTCAFERHFITRNGQNSPAAGGFAPGRPPVAFLLRLDLGVP